jgi:hypothetical protein
VISKPPKSAYRLGCKLAKVSAGARVGVRCEKVASMEAEVEQSPKQSAECPGAISAASNVTAQSGRTPGLSSPLQWTFT